MDIRITALLLACTPLIASAAGVVTLEDSSGSRLDRTTFEYLDQHTARLNYGSSDRDGYMLIRDGKAYAVSYDDGKPVVMDMAEMATFARQMGNQMGQQPQATMGADRVEDFQSMKKTGRRETVAGIEGDVYQVSWRENGKLKSEEVVLSEDPRAVEFTEAFISATRTLGQTTKTEHAMADTDSLFGRLQRDRLGMLRFGSDTRVAAFQDGAERSRFELPAPVTSMQDMMYGGGAAGAGGDDDDTGGGMFGGLFGKAGAKAEQQKDRQEQRVEQKTDSAIDRTVDKAVDGLLKGLFK